jgi:hypothetical protein
MDSSSTTSTAGEVVHRLPGDPVHLYQLDKSPGAYYNTMGCGAFTTAMALSLHDRERFGTYDAARMIFEKMRKVPFFGGTFESQNAAIGQQFNVACDPYDRGTPADLAAAIDCGAPTILLINPNFLSIGRHDVLLVGYSVDAEGRYARFFVDNPAVESDTQQAPPGLLYPGNEAYSVAVLSKKWTRCFTPFFPTDDAYLKWLLFTGRA